MGIANKKKFQDVEPCFLRATDHCFYCGSVLSGEQWVYWNGNDERNVQIWLHPDCASRLAFHLNKDYANTKSNP